MRDGAPEGLKRKEWSEVILGLCQEWTEDMLGGFGSVPTTQLRLGLMTLER